MRWNRIGFCGTAATGPASIEHAVVHLGCRFIVVFAHEGCGAVEAAVEGGDAGKHLNRLLEYIAPAVRSCPGASVDEVARENARMNVDRLTSDSEILSDAVERDQLEIVASFFHFRNGAVEFL